jgi:hypothetical protein
VGLDRLAAGGPDVFPIMKDKTISSEMQQIYSETCKAHVWCHSSFIVKQHEERDTVFSLGLNENVVVLECDYFMQEVRIELPATAARTYKKESLVRLHFNI